MGPPTMGNYHVTLNRSSHWGPVSGDVALSQGLDQPCTGSCPERLHCTIPMCHVHTAREVSADRENQTKSRLPADMFAKHDLFRSFVSTGISLVSCIGHIVVVSTGRDQIIFVGSSLAAPHCCGTV